MPIHKLKLIDRREVARGTLMFTFEKPANFVFTPGQYGGFTLINPIGVNPTAATRRFSLLSAPDDAHIVIAMRMQNSDYKNVLKELPIGSEVKFAGPSGNFILHEDTKIPAVLIAGGIGITPFHSMISHLAKHPSTRQLYLFYGNQTPNDAAFLNELTAIERAHPNIKLIAAMAADNTWTGETGFISDDMIKKYVKDIFIPIYYVCGSPAMVTAIQEMLLEMGISSDNIRIEDFPGY